MKVTYQQKLKKLGHTQTEQTLNLQGQKLSKKYVILDLIAKGTNSLIYYGIQEQSLEERVIKFYNFKQIQFLSSFYDKQIVKRLSNYEAGFMRKCRSLHILKCYDVYEDNNYKMIVSQYCNMGSLKDQISKRKNKIINELRAIIILKQILIGLKNIHNSCNRMHKNLKSQNILIKNGVYKLIDFGLPTSISQVRSSDDSNFKIPQLLTERSYDEKAEVWNVGVLFYQIIFGQLPQPILSKSKSLMAINNPESIYNRNDNWISAQTKKFLRSCLFINPENRLTWFQLENHQMFQLLKANLTVRQYQSLSQIHERSQSVRMISQIIIDQDALSQQNQLFSCSSQYTQQSNKPNIENFVFVPEEFYKQKRFLQVQMKQIQKQLDKNYQKIGQDYQLSKMLEASEKYFRQKINKQEYLYYQSLKQYYNDCLKVQFILEELIRPIKRMIQTIQQKQLIQFMYLLLSRCFTALSWINQFSQKKNQQKYNNMILLHIKTQTKALYNRIKQSWEKSSHLLTQEQDKLKNKLIDYFKKKINSAQYIKQQVFFCGIQSIDYNREDQIKYTQSFFNQKVLSITKKMEEEGRLFQKGNNYSQLKKYMRIYDKIWDIKQNICQYYCFIKDYINQQLLSKNHH